MAIIITRHRPMLRQFAYIFGALLLFASFMLVLLSLTYSGSINQFYYQTVINESNTASASTNMKVSPKDDFAFSLLSGAQTVDKIQRLRNIARHGEVCGDEESNGGHGVPTEFKMLFNTSQSENFYAKVGHETEQSDNNINMDQQDLATVLLPKYSNDISLNNISNSLYLYNAFHSSFDREARHKPRQRPMKLTIIGIALREIYCPNKSSGGRLLFCAFDSGGHGFHHDQHYSTEYRTNASIECLPEGHDQRFSSVMLNCRVPARLRSHKSSHKLTTVVSSVRIIERNTNRSHISGPVQIVNNNDPSSGHYEQSANTFNEQQTNNNNDITVCVRPLFGPINVLNLLEFIAFYRTNGVSRVVLYHYDFPHNITTTNSSGETMSRAVHFLKLLSRLTGVRLHRFVLPKCVGSDIHAGAQIVTVHDCLLRYPNSVQIYVDIDEFVFAQSKEHEQRKTTIRQWVQSQLDTNPRHVALYIANVLHCHEFNLNNSMYYELSFGVRSHCNSHSDQCINREKNHFYHTLNSSTVKRALIVPNSALCQRTVWPHEIRSKVVLLHPKLVKHMGIHNVWKFDEDHVISSDNERARGDGDRDGFLSFIKRQLTRINPFRNGANESNNNNTTATQAPLQYYSYLKVDPTEAILRHYRWCCQIQQPHFFDLFHFYSVDDAVEDMKASLSPSTYHSNLTTQVESYVLRHFELFLQESKRSRGTTSDNRDNAEY